MRSFFRVLLGLALKDLAGNLPHIDSLVLTPDLLARVFGIAAHLADGPDGPIFQPLRVTPRA